MTDPLLQPGDAFLLCTNGFWEHVTETEMEIDFASSGSPQEWLASMEQRLLASAPSGNDNYSAVAVWIVAGD